MNRIGEVLPYALARLRDKERFHPENPADYQGSVGWPIEKDGEVVGYGCVGCWSCCPDFKRWARVNGVAA